MKNTCLLIAVLVCNLAAQAQLKTTAVCPGFTIDILRGRINETLDIKSTLKDFKTTFPCFTSAEDETTGTKCGGGVFYKDKDIYFYTGRDYIEIGEKFKGKLSVPLMGAPRNGLYKWLGNPSLKDVTFDVYPTAYGIIILYFNKANKVNKIQFSVESVNTIKLCEN